MVGRSMYVEIGSLFTVAGPYPKMDPFFAVIVFVRPILYLHGLDRIHTRYVNATKTLKSDICICWVGHRM